MCDVITDRKILTDLQSLGSSELRPIEPIVDELATSPQPRARTMPTLDARGISMEEPIPSGAEVTEDDWRSARTRTRRAAYIGGIVGIIVGPLLGLLAVYLTSLTASGGARYLVDAMWMAVLVAPMAVILSLRSVREQDKSDGVIATLAHQFEAQAHGREIREPPGKCPGHVRRGARGRPGD